MRGGKRKGAGRPTGAKNKDKKQRRRQIGVRLPAWMAGYINRPGASPTAEIEDAIMKKIIIDLEKAARDAGVYDLPEGLQRPAAEEILERFGNPEGVIWTDAWKQGYDGCGKPCGEVENPDHGFGFE